MLKTELDLLESLRKIYFLKNSNVLDYTIREDGRFELFGDIDLRCCGLIKLPDLSNVILNGDFNCSDNVYLDSLVGAPKVINGDFTCNNTSIESLYGSPVVVKGDFDVSDNNKLYSEIHSPTLVGSYKRNNCKCLTPRIN